MPMPEMDEKSRKRPLSYDPSREKFIRFDDISSGEEKIISVDSLSEDDLKKLVIERWKVLPEDTTVQAISGPPFSRDDVIRAIEQDEPFGRMTLEAERSYLRDLLDEIQQNLDSGGSSETYPSPELLGLDISGCDVVFRWSWARQLAEDEYFALRVGIGTPGPGKVWTKDTRFTLSLTDAGEYVWEIAVCRGDPETHVCEQLAVSEQSLFSFGGCPT